MQDQLEIGIKNDNCALNKKNQEVMKKQIIS